MDIVARSPACMQSHKQPREVCAYFTFLMFVVCTTGRNGAVPSYFTAALALLRSTCPSAWHLAGLDHIVFALVSLPWFAGEQAEAVLRAALVASWLAATPAARTHTRAGDPAALIGGLQLDDAGGRSLPPAAAPVAREVGVLGAIF